MNKKIIGAILCVSVIIIGAMPVMGQPGIDENYILDTPSESPETHIESPEYPEDPEEPQPNITIYIEGGFHKEIEVNLVNTGNTDLTNVNWKMKITRRGLLFKRQLLNANGSFELIENETGKTVTKRPDKFGFCPILVTVTVNADELEEPVTKTAKGFQILKFTRIRKIAFPF
ncbi:MAG: hypothetical protein ACXAC7_23325 [Candidatus Hodarchaeales archaeon]|jgi:hypothetical protein